MRTRLVALSSLVTLSSFACINIDTDTGEGVDDPQDIDGPTIEFDPSNAIVPFPNNLLLNPSTGLVSLPEQCGESATETALRVGVLNTLNGFGSYKTALRVTLSEAVDPTSLTDRIIMYRRATGTTAAVPETATAVPIVAFPGTTSRANADCTETDTIDTITIVPTVPLAESSTYVIAILNGVQTSGGESFLPSFIWGLVRELENPVTLDESGVVVSDRTPLDPGDAEDNATLIGIDLLWKAHATGLAFFEAANTTAREDILLAWDFNTQTATAPLDPTIAGSLAETLPGTPPAGTASITGGASGEDYMIGVLGAPTCSAIGCDAIGDVVAGGLIAPNYQSDVANPLAGGDAIPGMWSNPLTPIANGTPVLEVLAFIPDAAPPLDGYPVVVFGHGLGGSKESLFAIASQLAGAGFASVAIDFVAHGSRAIQNSDAAALGCDGAVDPSTTPQCYAPLLSADLGATRDNLRQSALDILALVEGLKGCTAGACGALDIDADRIGYMGISLGSLIGANSVAVSPDIAASVLNVGGVGWIDVLENTETFSIVCPLVDALIALGIVEGTPWDGGTNGTCTTDDWKNQEAYQSFANIARWIIDPADNANYTAQLATKTFLIQQVVGDTVVPNIATATQGALVGLTAEAAAATDGGTITPSSAIDSAREYLNYESATADGAFLGRSYTHGSLLVADGSTESSLATSQMQTDAITFLVTNLPAL